MVADGGLLDDSRRRPVRLTRHGRGAFLLEAVLALVVFSIGAAGLLGVIANAQRESGNARWRGEAFDIASSTLSRMSTEDPALLDARYDAATRGTGYRALLAAAVRLPGVDSAVNAPVVTLEDAPSDRRTVRITVYWQLPGEAAPHHASAAGMLLRH